MSDRVSRRRILTTGLAAAAGVAALATADRIADRYGLLAPDSQGLFGLGEALTYGAQRVLTAGGSMAREFKKSDISTVHPVNHEEPDDDPYQRLARGRWADWRLYIDGLVARPASFSLDELKGMPTRTQITEMNCEEGWSYIAAWTGVPLAYLLNAVGVKPEARWVVFYPFNDVWGSIDMAEAVHPQTLLATEMNGDDLEPGHGAPVRLRLPKQLGYKNLKYIARISVTSSLRGLGDGTGSASPELGYSWYAGI